MGDLPGRDVRRTRRNTIFAATIKTYRLKVVGALSIPMMCIQTPGAVLMVLNIAMRPGTDWTSWITFATAGIMQGSLLIMCLVWKARQTRLRIDDFGNPTGPDVPTVTVTNADSDVEDSEEQIPRVTEYTSLLRQQENAVDRKKPGLLSRLFGW